MTKKYQGITPWKLITCDFTGFSSPPIEKRQHKKAFLQT